MLEELCRLSREVRRSPAKKIKSSQFRQLGFWLLAMLIYINRSRRQAASLLTNSDFANGKKQRSAALTLIPFT
jgi:hypothetical protein